jgi:hypothetical protein
MDQPPTSNDSPDEPARDAWLSEALRHAPDADAAPSVAVRETILRQARAEAATAHATPRPAGGWQRLSAAWSWLSGPRVAAAFASVMVATVIGLIWWDRPIDEALRPVEPPTTVAAPAAAPAPAEEPAPAPAPSRPAPSAEPPRDLAAATPPRTAPERKREAVRPRADTSNDVRRDAPTTPPAAPRAADDTRALGDAAESARADKEAKEIDAARERRAEPLAQAKSAAPAMRSAPAATAGSLYAPAPAAAPAPAPPPVAAAESRQARSSAPLGALLEALADEAPRWRWQRDGNAEQTMTPELQAWLQRVDRAAAGRWSAADPGQGSGQVQAPAQELRLLRDGGVQAIVRLGADGRVRIDIAGEAPLTTQLPAAGAAALRRALDDATR